MPLKYINTKGDIVRRYTVRISVVGDRAYDTLNAVRKEHGWTMHQAIQSAFAEGLANVQERYNEQVEWEEEQRQKLIAAEP